jgi:hypothetical protein
VPWARTTNLFYGGLGFGLRMTLKNGSHVEDDAAYLIYEMDHVDD